MEKGETKRMTIAITSIEEVVPFGDKGATKLPFKARVDDKTLSFVCYSKRLMDYIKPNETIETDVNISQREWEGNTYTDRKVIQIYSGGQPVSSKPNAFRGKSHEDFIFEQQCTNCRTALMQAVIASQTKDLDDIAMLYHAFCKLLEGDVPQKIAEKEETVAKQPSPEPEATPAPSGEATRLLEVNLDDDKAYSKLISSLMKKGITMANLQAEMAAFPSKYGSKKNHMELKGVERYALIKAIEQMPKEK